MSDKSTDLRARALRLLAAREYSAAELTRKLAQAPPPKRTRRRPKPDSAATPATSRSTFADGASDSSDGSDVSDACDEFETVSPVPWDGARADLAAASPPEPVVLSRREQAQAREAAALQVVQDFNARGYQSDQRYAESQARRRAGQMSQSAVRQALRGAGVHSDIAAAALAEFGVDDLEAARALWQRKFGQPAVDAKARAKQVRFLQARGFGFSVISKVLDLADAEDASADHADWDVT